MSMHPYVLVLAQTSHEGATYVRRANLPRGRWRIVARASSIAGIRKAEVHCLPGFHKRPDRHAILGQLRYAQCEWKDVEMPPRAEAAAVDQGDGMGQQLTIEDVLDVIRGAASDVAERAEVPVELVEAPVPMPTVGRPAGTPAPVAMPTVESPGAGLDAERIIADSRPRFPTTRQVEAAYRYNNILQDLASEAANDEDLQVRRGMRDDTEDATPAPKRRRSRCADCGELHFKDESCVRTDGVEEAPVAPVATMFD